MKARDAQCHRARQPVVDHYDLHLHSLDLTLLPMPTSPATARPLADALRDSPYAAPLLARCEATQRAALLIAPTCRSVAGFDPLAPGTCELRGETLWLTLPSAAHSAKLRQAMPRLLSTLAAGGMAVYELRTRVQPVVTSYPTDGTVAGSSHATPEMAWPNTGKSAASAFSNWSAQLADPALKQAAEKLAATLRRRAAKPFG